MIRPEQKKLFAVIGNPVRHSLSPVMMSACFEALKVPALYAAFYVDELDCDLKLLHKTGFSGLSVTVPYKEIACRLAEEIDKTAEEIGAANTLRRTNLGWEGINTDWVGALRALSAVVDVSGRQGTYSGRRWGRSGSGFRPEKGRSGSHDLEPVHRTRQGFIKAARQQFHSAQQSPKCSKRFRHSHSVHLRGAG